MKRRTLLLGGLAAAIAAPAILRAAQTPEPSESLEGPQLDPASGTADWLVVLAHGSGGDGPNMYGLAPALQPYLPNAAFVSPTGPYPREDWGYRWFPGALGDDPIAMVMRGVNEGGPIANRFFEAELAMRNLTADKLILLGFSQGAMMSLNFGLRRAPLPAAIVAFAGLQLATEGLPQFNGAPPTLLIQGALDGDPARLGRIAEMLEERGVPVEQHLLSGLGHSIDHRGIELAGEFLQRVTGA